MKRILASESDVLTIAEPFLRDLWQKSWRYLEPDDRWNELCCLFVCAWRRLPVNTGHFLKDFEALCRPYMDALDRKARDRFYKERSMDGGIVCKRNNDAGRSFTHHHVLAAREDRSADRVEAFLDSLPPQDKAILNALLDGRDRDDIAREHSLDPSHLTLRLEALGRRYLDQAAL